ncbi:MAG: glycosyltransferase, partial [Candidatus Sumerlaeota bacterium]
MDFFPLAFTASLLLQSQIMNVVVIPTYNEAQNASALVKRIHAEAPGIVIIVVDDNSPDGTGEIVRRLPISGLHVVVRKDARG